MDDFVRAMDKRAHDRIQEADARKTLAVGEIKGTSFAGASVQIEGSQEYLPNVPALQGVDLVIGSRVLLARVRRQTWIIVGAVETKGKVTITTANSEPMSQPANLTITDLETGAARIEWDASYFDVHLYELQVGDASDPEDEDTETILTDNSQYNYVGADGAYFARVCAVGPDWYRSSYTAWQAFNITSTALNTDHGLLLGLGDDDHTIYLLADGTRALSGNLSVNPGITIDGVDVGAHGDRHDQGGADALSDVPDHDHTGDAGDGGVLVHGDLSELSADDHTIYVLADGSRDLAFTPAVITDWDSDADPGDVDDALDQLAERVDDLENASPVYGDASDITYTPSEVADWDSGDPGDVDAALDELAERIADLEGAAPVYGDASDIAYVVEEADYWHGHASEIDNVQDAIDHAMQPHWISERVQPYSVRLPGSNAPAADEIDGISALRFDRGTEESVYYSWTVPQNWYATATSLRGHFHFVVENPPSGGGDEVVVMGFDYKKISPGDVFSFSSPSTGTLEETIADGETPLILHSTPAGTCDTTGWAEGDVILFRFFRDATNPNDTYDNEPVGADNDVWMMESDLEYLAVQ